MKPIGQPAAATLIRNFFSSQRFSHPWFIFGVQLVLSAIFLSLICNWHSFYEEDELAKAAQVTALARGPNWFQFAHATDYYEKDLFSSYYLAATAFFNLTHLRPVQALNLFSVVCGTIFLAVTPAVLRRAFSLPPWLTWIALLNTPVLIITFCYGNEAAFAITMSALAALALTFGTVSGLIAGGILYGLAAYGRSDYLFLFPALSMLAIAGKGAVPAWRQSLRNLLIFATAAMVFGLSYLALILRSIPRPELFEYATNNKLFAAFVLYSPNPFNFLLAVLGFGFCVAHRRAKYYFLLLVLLQSLPYLTRLTTPKYILPSLVVVAVFSAVGMQMIFRHIPVLLPIIVLAPWFVAVTPFGVFGPARSVFWYVPSDDGPVPTGGYLAFYSKVRQGFYQRRYDQEHEQIAKAMPILAREPQGADLIGYLNHQSFRLWAVENQRWDWSFDKMPFPFWDPDLIDDEAHRAKFMIKTSYLYPFKQVPAARASIDHYYQEGRMKAPGVAGTQDPFPDLIQIGRFVPPGSDTNLARRILFINDYDGGNQSLRRDSFLRDFKGVSWITRADFSNRGTQLPKPIYADDEWVCFSEPVAGAIYYSLRFPPAYSRLR